jgi:hypothetical protein
MARLGLDPTWFRIGQMWRRRRLSKSARRLGWRIGLRAGTPGLGHLPYGDQRIRSSTERRHSEGLRTRGEVETRSVTA